MIKGIDKNAIRSKRHRRIRHTLHGTADRPRLNVYRSLNNIYVQIIDDDAGRTLVSASTLEKGHKEKTATMSKKEASKVVGELAGKRALEKGIKKVVFDRGGYLYTGRVAEVAAGAREAGLDF
ncbi:MAG: 50S ribosomal protein L18 [Christensenellales bacterium]|jgi:large subunit ribosomal protein L18